MTDFTRFRDLLPGSLATSLDSDTVGVDARVPDPLELVPLFKVTDKDTQCIVLEDPSCDSLAPESSDDSIWSMLDNVCIGQQENTVEVAGAHAGCVSDDGAYDMMGNLARVDLGRERNLSWRLLRRYLHQWRRVPLQDDRSQSCPLGLQHGLSLL